MTTPQREALPAHPAMFAALAVPNFRRYVSGQSLSLKLTHSGTILGLTTAGAAGELRRRPTRHPGSQTRRDGHFLMQDAFCCQRVTTP